ncbi:MAG: fibronectin type III domain-containing protein [Mogibacterium sp.]|nr:fibronectin type III domain-containing protein [Mogibacterium sp.]
MQEEKEAKTENNTATDKSRKRRRRLSPAASRKWRRFFLAAFVLLAVMITAVAVTVVNHYKTYPGKVERDSLSSPGRGLDYIVVSWEAARNADVYKVWWKEIEPKKEKTGKPVSGKEESTGDEEKAGTVSDDPAGGDAGDAGSENRGFIVDDSWTELETDVPEITVTDLKKDTSYAFVVRADSKEKEGTATAPRTFSTKKKQKIKVSKKITKFTFSKPFRLKVAAETNLMYESADPDIAEVDPETNEIIIKGAGDTEITVTARSSVEYESASKTVDLKVIDSTPVSAGGAYENIIYHLDADNCEVAKTVTGEGGAVVPQGLGYTGDKYIISYGMGSPNRIISFDVEGDGKEVSVPTISMGHPNGFAYANENGLCYVAKGWTSKVFTYEPTSDSYGSLGLSYGCSGVGYDRKEKLLYTCSRTAMVAYDISDGYSVKYSCGVVKHGGTVYTQDCGGHAGIMLRCLSGSSKHGINYIDLYDMKNGRYLGTFSCDLSEVESCIVDNDGFLEILANNSSNVDYIWKTDLNIETLGEGL